MSQGVKHPLRVASECARELACLVGPAHVKRWEIAGSVRRGEERCGDCEHVVVPLWGSHTHDGDIFPRLTNLTFLRLDEMLREGLIDKAVDSAGRECWGERQRRFTVVGQPQSLKHEVFLADEDWLGVMLAIRTGPAELSMRLVQLIRTGMETPRGRMGGGHRCEKGRVYSLATGAELEGGVREEEDFFKLCGVVGRDGSGRISPRHRGDLLVELVRAEQRARVGA